MKRELWKADNWEEYRLEQEEKERIKQAESGTECGVRSIELEGVQTGTGEEGEDQIG